MIVIKLALRDLLRHAAADVQQRRLHAVEAVAHQLRLEHGLVVNV